MKSTITDRGQITIPKRLRDRYGLREGVDVEFVEDKGDLRLRKASRRGHPVQDVFGVLGRKGERTDDYIEEVRGR